MKLPYGQHSLDNDDLAAVAAALSDSEAVCRFLSAISKRRPSVRAKAKRYWVTVGTKYDGRSSDLARLVISDITSGGRSVWSGWKRIPTAEIEAYEPDESADVWIG